jgi:gluconate 2-dehydrogenase gamma chain
MPTDEPSRQTFFNAHQRATVEAAMACIIPTDDTPGAREAGTVDFVDRYLSGIDCIYAKPDGSGFETLTGKRAEAWRSRVETLREKYRQGLAELDERSRTRFADEFVALQSEQQIAVLTELERAGHGEATTLTPSHSLSSVAAEGPALQQTSTETELAFFPLLVAHTRQGFYADPIYGGNRDRLGWQVIGFPGPTSMAEVFEGHYGTLDYFAEGDAHVPAGGIRGA